MDSTKRPPSPEPPSDSAKRPRTDEPPAFIPTLFDPTSTNQLAQEYANSQPYRHAVVDRLFPDELLATVRDELAVNDGGLVGFAHKSTDIYSLNQSFDLSSLSTDHLPASTLAKLPGLQQLKASMYSPEFRAWVRKVTGCGPLSQSKVDASSARYTKGCHLLLHDDVISTRRISWIMYLPTEPWSPEDGGALELYPALPTPLSSLFTTSSSASPSSTAVDSERPKTWRDEIGSSPTPSKSIPPKWAQFIFFEVQPGKSYHAVQEVVADLPKERLSISGWFHKPCEGEEGYEGPEEEGAQSSLAQITQSPLSSTFTPYPSPPPPLPSTSLTQEEIAFLEPYLEPQYLNPQILSLAAEQFAGESFILLDRFLKPSFAEELEQGLRELDAKAGLGVEERKGCIPEFGVGEEEEGWEVVGPSTRQRFLSLSTSPLPITTKERNPASKSTELMHDLLNVVLPSEPFRSWLSILSAFPLQAHKLEGRRLRPGLDYTLARGEEGEESRLDVRLGLTPGGKWEEMDGGDGFGGWEAYLAPPDEDDDPAVYQASKPSKKDPAALEDDDDEDEEEDDDDDGPLLTIQPSFNTLLVVLRDPKVMKFTKYVSASAPCSRFDIGGEWDLGVLDKDDDEDDGEADAEGHGHEH